MQKDLKIISSGGRSVASALIANSAPNSLYRAAKNLLRRKACAKRAELALNKVEGGDWLVAIKRDTIQATQSEIHSDNCVSYRKNWICFDVLADGTSQVKSGSHAHFVLVSAEMCCVTSIDNSQGQIDQPRPLKHEQRLLRALQKIHAVANPK